MHGNHETIAFFQRDRDRPNRNARYCSQYRDCRLSDSKTTIQPQSSCPSGNGRELLYLPVYVEQGHELNQQRIETGRPPRKRAPWPLRTKLIYLLFLAVYLLVGYPAQRLTLAYDSLKSIHIQEPHQVFQTIGLFFYALLLAPILVANRIIVAIWTLVSLGCAGRRDRFRLAPGRPPKAPGQKA